MPLVFDCLKHKNLILTQRLENSSGLKMFLFDSIMPRKIRRIFDEAVDDCLAASKVIPD